MAFRKREPAAVIHKATTKAAAMQQIDTNHDITIDYGGPVRGELTAVTLQARLTGYASKLQQYNQFLQQADALSNTLDDMERDISSDCTVILKAAPGKFGDNSNELEMLGGTRKEERKKRKPKKAA